MSGLKPVIQEGDMTDNAKPIGKDGEFISITEMAVDILLFGIGAGSGLRRHETVSHLIRVNVRVIFIVCLEPTDKGIEKLGIIFRDIKLNAGGIKSKDGGKGGIDRLANGFGIIHHALKMSSI